METRLKFKITPNIVRKTLLKQSGKSTDYLIVRVSTFLSPEVVVSEREDGDLGDNPLGPGRVSEVTIALNGGFVLSAKAFVISS